MISPSPALPQSNAFPILVTPSSITKVWARTQHAPSFGVMRTAFRLHLRNQKIYLPTVSFVSFRRTYYGHILSDTSLHGDFTINKIYLKDSLIFIFGNDIRDTCDEIYRKPSYIIFILSMKYMNGCIKTVFISITISSWKIK